MRSNQDITISDLSIVHDCTTYFSLLDTLFLVAGFIVLVAGFKVLVAGLIALVTGLIALVAGFCSSCCLVCILLLSLDLLAL